MMQSLEHDGGNRWKDIEHLLEGSSGARQQWLPFVDGTNVLYHVCMLIMKGFPIAID